jgi:hypothetical protein
LRSVPIERFVNRPETTGEYTGNAGSTVPAEYATGEYMDSTNIELGAAPMGSAFGGSHAGDYGKQGNVAYPNNRSTNLWKHGKNIDNRYYGAIGGSIGAVIAPILDILRPSRRGNTVGNLRPYQNAKSAVQKSYVYNPADRPSPTVKDTTLDTKFHANVNSNQNGGAYQVSDQQAISNQRDTTTDFYYSGGGERGAQIRPYDAEYRQRNNDIKSSTIEGRMVPGNMSLLNPHIHMTTNTRDSKFENIRPLVTNSSTGRVTGPSVDTMGGSTQTQSSNYSGMQADRNNGEVLSQLKKNPYTHSIIGGI